jgi:hypothetical protein
MTVASLRDTAAILDSSREHVPVKDGDAVEVRTEDTSRNEPADAAPDDDGVLTLRTTGRRY